MNASRVYVILTSTILSFNIVEAQIQYFERETSAKYLDSLRALNNNISPLNDPLELATRIALQYYPELGGHKIKIKYKKSVRYPVTASWAISNIFTFRKSHKYVLLISPNSFLKRISLNNQIGVIGHEMAHFVYYSKQPTIGMVWWGLKYSVSKKFKRKFERAADKATIDHGLGYQLIDVVFYMSREEVELYMKETGKLP